MKLKSYIIGGLVLLAFSNKAISQQEIQVSQYMVAPMLVNPAFTSVADYWETNLVYRNQCVGVEDAPISYYVSTQTTIGKPHNSRTHKGDFHSWHGTGRLLMRDEIGAFKNTRLKLNYSYNMALTKGKAYGYQHKDGLRFALGVFGEYASFKLDKSILGKSQELSGNKIFNNRALNDETYQRLSESPASTFDMTIGGMLYYQETYFLGISSSQVFQNEISLGASSLLQRHYYVSGMIKAQVNEQWYIIPSFLTKVVKGAPVSVDVNLQADYNDQFFLGGGYRHGDAVTLLVGYRH